MVNSIRVALYPLAITLVSSTVTYLGGLVTTNPIAALLINVAVLGLTYLDSYLTAQEAETAASPAKSPSPSASTLTPTAIVATPAPTPTTAAPTGDISYTLGGATITVTPYEPIGTKDANGYVVGSAIAYSVTLPSGDVVPAGAVYLGMYEGNANFEFNGNYYS